MQKQHTQAGSQDSPAVCKPVLQQTAAGWTIHMADASGNKVLNLAVFPSRFLAEEALARMLERQGGK